MIVWWLDLQLPMQLVPIITNIVPIPLRRGVVNTTLCNKVCQWLAAGRWFSLGTPVSSTNKTDNHDIIEIFLKMALNTITWNRYVTCSLLISEDDISSPKSQIAENNNYGIPLYQLKEFQDFSLKWVFCI